jgi:hypothetical protein
MGLEDEMYVCIGNEIIGSYAYQVFIDWLNVANPPVLVKS